VRSIRVLVANRPRLMRELVVATISSQPDIEIVGEAENQSDILEIVEKVRPDVLIIGLEDQEQRPALCGFLLGRHPGMKVIAVAAHKNSTVFYWANVDIRSKQLETSEEGILSALRNSAAILPSHV
jgi:two-component system, NarL family, response regulator DegU